MALASGMTAGLSELMQPMIDRIFNNKEETALVPVALGVMGAFVLRGGSTYLHSVIMNDVGQRIVADIQRMTFKHFLKSDLVFFHTHPAGELISRLTSDVGVMRTAVAEVLTSFGRSSLTLIFLIGVMFQQDWQLAIISIPAFPAAGYFVARLGKRMRRISGNTQAELASFSQPDEPGFPVDASRQGVWNGGFRNGARRPRHPSVCTNWRIRFSRVGALSQPITEALSGVAIVTLVTYGGHEVIAGHKTQGQFFSFITAFLLAYEPLKRAAKLNGCDADRFGRRRADFLCPRPEPYPGRCARRRDVTAEKSLYKT